MTKFSTWGHHVYRVLNGTDAPITINLAGRASWALECLLTAGPKGCTAMEESAPRWSAYVYALRSKGFDIHTIHESHGGPFPGHHARYVLRSDVTRIKALAS